MIAHPTAATLIAKHGNTAEGRCKAREELADIMLAAAHREIARAARSHNCEQRAVWRGPDHEPCGNDGSGCLCECHDPTEAAPPERTP